MAGIDVQFNVVDQSHDERTRNVCSGFRGVHYQHSERSGISFNRNLGAEACRGEWLLFLDDDATLTEGFGTELMRLLAETAQIDLVVPLFLDPSGNLLVEVPRDGPTRIGSSNLWSASGGCIVVRRSAFLRVGGFDERLGVGARWGSAEDQDLTLRLIDAGHLCMVEPSLAVTHPRSPVGMGAERRRAYSYGLGIGAFFRLHLLRSDDPGWVRQARQFMLHPLWEIVHAPLGRTTPVRIAELAGRWLGFLLGPTPTGPSRSLAHSVRCLRSLRRGKIR